MTEDSRRPARKRGRCRRRNIAGRAIILVVLLAALSAGAAGQEPGRIRVEVRAGGEVVAGATVVVAETSQLTDAAGVALVPAPAGVVHVTVVHEGFVPVTVPVTLGGGRRSVSSRSRSSRS